jgi:hypothetical protein
MNVMILQDPYDKSVPAYNPTRIFSPTAAYDMTPSDFKGVHGGVKHMIGLPFKMPTMETLPVMPPSEAEMEGEGYGMKGGVLTAAEAILEQRSLDEIEHVLAHPEKYNLTKGQIEELRDFQMYGGPVVNGVYIGGPLYPAWAAWKKRAGYIDSSKTCKSDDKKCGPPPPPAPPSAPMVPVGAGRAKPMPESEPENDEDLKKALRGMGLPAQ